MTILAIDPGNEQSAWCLYDGARPRAFGKGPNARVLDLVKHPYGALQVHVEHLAIEMIASFGMPVGAEVFDTVRWIGRFEQAWSFRDEQAVMVYRRDVKLHLCGSSRAKDGNVRQALIDRWGGKAAALGTKAKPGPLYGFKADAWQALAVAVTYSDTQSQLCATTQANAKQCVAP